MTTFKNMRLVAYKDEKFNSKVAEYVVMLNPESLKWGRTIEYNEEQPIDASAPSQKYNKTPGEKLSFDITIDCTGVVDSSRVDLPTEITNLSTVVYDYNGEIHRPNFVAIYWGKGLSFQGVLTTFDSSYTYFKPDGTALRAKVSLAFTSYINPSLRAQQDADESPDITHLVSVVEGDTLPQISKNILDSPDYYIQVARYNGLNKFRQIAAGSQIVIPPLVPEGSVPESTSASKGAIQ